MGEKKKKSPQNNGWVFITCYLIMPLYNLPFASHSKGITLWYTNANWIGGGVRSKTSESSRWEEERRRQVTRRGEKVEISNENKRNKWEKMISRNSTTLFFTVLIKNGFVCVRVCVRMCDLTDQAGALWGEVNRPKPGANVLVGVWERLIRTRSKRL